MARPGWAPVATLFRDNPFFIRSPGSPLELSWSTKSRPALPSFHQRLQAAFPGPSLSPRRGLKPGT